MEDATMLTRTVLCLTLVMAAPAAARLYGASALEEYVAREDGGPSWEKRRTMDRGGASVHVLSLVSQTWRGHKWRHNLFVIRPQKIVRPHEALLMVAGGSNRPGFEGKIPKELDLLVGVSEAVGSCVALLTQVPNQPLFDRLFEDECIAYTFDKYLRTGDKTWPLLLPMVKSAVRAMDAVQAYLRETEKISVRRFFVTGASKRGWTTWLTAAVDTRVAGLAPMVIDVLNIPAQMAHQLRCWGKYSEQIGDYTKLGIQERMTGKGGPDLVRMVDPYFHRRRIVKPKLIIIGTNDRYWPVDAACLYFFDLSGPKYLLYVPNAGHSLNLTVVPHLTAFTSQVMAGKELPAFSWSFERAGSLVMGKIILGTPCEKIALWRAGAPTRDFRSARWAVADTFEGEKDGCYFVVDLEKGGSAWTAFYAALTFKNHLGKPFVVCTTVGVYAAGEDGKEKKD
jgi:PhoPQ-activated pathogenicity-related protein